MDIKNLVFEGGGVKGVAYSGALIALESMGKLNSLERVAGASAGAICAALLSVGLKGQNIAEILSAMKMSSFKDSNFGILRDSYRLFTKYGWYRGDAFCKWFGDVLENHAFIDRDITLSQLYSVALGPEFNAVGTSLTKKKSVIFNHKSYPDIKLVEAVRISMSIPVFFVPIRLNGEIFVDGGVLNNYPIKVFDQAHNPAQTLGLRLDSTEEAFVHETKLEQTFEIKNLIDFLSLVFNSVYDNLHLQSLDQTDWQRTIIIDTGDVSAIDFGLKERDIARLIGFGQRDVRKYISRTLYGTEPLTVVT